MKHQHRYRHDHGTVGNFEDFARECHSRAELADIHVFDINQTRLIEIFALFKYMPFIDTLHFTNNLNFQNNFSCPGTILQFNTHLKI